jgi:hypothetical protein
MSGSEKTAMSGSEERAMSGTEKTAMSGSEKTAMSGSEIAMSGSETARSGTESAAMNASDRPAMHELVARINDAELCYVFARNANRKGHPELALQALRRAVDLKAESHGPASAAERAALRSVYAYEEALGHIKGKRTRATGTWQLVNRHGVLEAVARRMDARDSEAIRAALAELQMEDYSFESVYGAYPGPFSEAAA